MKHCLKISLFIIIINISSCSKSRVEDFFVPELPLEEQYFEIDQNQGFGKVLKFDFTLFKTNYNLTFDIEKSDYENIINTSKENKYDSGLGMRQDQYDVYIYDQYDQYILNTIIDAISESEGRNDFDLAQLLVAFVQSIPYDNNANEPKFTIETLFNQTGDCDDKSILLAKLLSYAGYQSCLFIFEKGQHMAVGLKVDDITKPYIVDDEGNGYIFIESTGNHPIGSIPERFADNVDIRNETPKIIEVDVANSDHAISAFDELRKFYSVVKSKYGYQYFNTTIKGRVLLEKMVKLEFERKKISSEMSKLSGNIDSKRNNLDNTNELEINEFNKLVNQYNDLRDLFNGNVNQYNSCVNKLNIINSENYIK